MDILKKLSMGTLFLDGGLGTLLQARGLEAGHAPESLLLTRPELVTDAHREYFEAGSNAVFSNSFGVNSLKYSDESDRMIAAAVECVQRARDSAKGGQTDKFVGLDIGPLGQLLEPLGELSLDEAIKVFSRAIRVGAESGADLIAIETMNDSLEARAALIAAKESCSLPVFVSCVFSDNEKTMNGASPESLVTVLESLGADVIGMNCSLGPKRMLELVPRFVAAASVPVMMKPNAGLPRVESGKTLYDVTAREFAGFIREAVICGAGVVGGCCGTTPETIREIVSACEGIAPPAVTKKDFVRICSPSKVVELGKEPILIGERLNPTGRKALQKAYADGDRDFVAEIALSQTEQGAQVLDVNAGVPGIDEAAVLEQCVRHIQSVCETPLQIDTGDPAAMERALRAYGGRAIVNSLNGEQKSMDSVLPLVKKYGALAICLTLDENGIPPTAEGRLAVARKILEHAKEYGLCERDLIFDTLTLTVASERGSARTTLDAADLIKRKLGCLCICGASNISFGLPKRNIMTSAFISIALGRGVDAFIANPASAEIQKSFHTYNALFGIDADCSQYIDFALSLGGNESSVAEKDAAPDLRTAVIKGLAGEAAAAAKKLLTTQEPIEVINEQIIPALDTVGGGFESGKVFLPQLLMSADAACAAFEVIRAAMPQSQATGPIIVLATVEGDIHDIGKNIVRAMLENYGYRVVDLGKNVSAQKVLESARENDSRLVGLSALMTTTVPAMESTIKLLHEELPECKIMVGGAVLTNEYAKAIGADAYSANAMQAVRVAGQLLEGK